MAGTRPAIPPRGRRHVLQSRHGSRLPRSGSGPRARRVRPDRVRCLAAIQRGTHRLHLHRRTGDGRPAAGDPRAGQVGADGGQRPAVAGGGRAVPRRPGAVTALSSSRQSRAGRGGASHTRLRSRPLLRRVPIATAPARRALPAAAGGGRGGHAGTVGAHLSTGSDGLRHPRRFAPSGWQPAP